MTAVPSLRVLSYNVHRWGDDRQALARVVRACAPEVALIQEAPTWWGTRRKREAMAATFGLRYVAASARNAILVADGTELGDPLHWRVWRPFVRRRLRLIATQLPGGAVGGRVNLGGVDLAMVVCHLGLHIGGRQRELEQVLKGCNSFNLPYLLVGDLNEEPDGPVWERLAAEGLTDLGAEGKPDVPLEQPRQANRRRAALPGPRRSRDSARLGRRGHPRRPGRGLGPPADAARDQPGWNSSSGSLTASRQRSRCPAACRR